MKRLRFGVIGCGGISTLYQLPALRASPAVELEAVCDTDGAWAQGVARRFGARRVLQDFRECIGQVDAVLVATPNHTHADIACVLLEAGIHVLCEKPMANTSAEIERMLDTANRSGSRLMAAHCLRFSPNVMLLKQMIAAGWFGDITSMSAAIGGPYEAGAQRTHFRRHKGLAGGGVLIDLGTHVIDLALWLSDDRPANLVYSASSAPGWEVETDSELTLEFGPNRRALLTASYTRMLDATLRVRGRSGWAAVPLYRPAELVLFSRQARICRRAGLQRLLLSEESMYTRQIAHFCEAVASGEPFVVRADEVRAVMQVIERCYEKRQAEAA